MSSSWKQALYSYLRAHIASYSISSLKHVMFVIFFLKKLKMIWNLYLFQKKKARNHFDNTSMKSEEYDLYITVIGITRISVYQPYRILLVYIDDISYINNKIATYT